MYTYIPEHKINYLVLKGDHYGVSHSIYLTVTFKNSDDDNDDA